MSRIDDAAQAFQQGRVMSGAVHKANCERDHYKDRCAELAQIIADAPHDIECGLNEFDPPCDCWKSKLNEGQANE